MQPEHKIMVIIPIARAFTLMVAFISAILHGLAAALLIEKTKLPLI
jgi:hypothetical protein